MRKPLFILFLLAAAILTFESSTARAAAQNDQNRLNFILVLVDDLGWTDLSCYGSSFYETPNIDRLAREGVRFTDAYSACTVCSPTRAAILTGKYPARLHITDWIAGHKRPYAKLKVPDWTMHLPLDEMNLAKAFKQQGYATVSIGKWHLGDEPFYPDKQGFDLNIGGTHRGQPPRYVAPYQIPTLTEGPPGEFLTDREALEAVNFIQRNKDKPFFIYLPHYAVHTPIAGKKEVIEKYRRKADPNAPHHNPTYAALIESVDDSMGRILSALDDLKLSERTVVIFTSDNGGLIGNPRNPITSNVPLRAGKGSSYEGGVRVPLIVKWPGHAAPGSIISVPVISTDLFPTLMQMAAIAPPRPTVIDGESLVPLLTGTGTLKRDSIYWHYPHYHPGGATPYGAIREADFKLIEFFEDNRIELYNLKKDIGERDDLASAMPDKASQLRSKLHGWRSRVGAQMPSLNPDYDPDRETQRPPANNPAPKNASPGATL